MSGRNWQLELIPQRSLDSPPYAPIFATLRLCYDLHHKFEIHPNYTLALNDYNYTIIPLRD